MFERGIAFLRHFWLDPLTPGLRARLVLLCVVLGALLTPRLARLSGLLEGQSQMPFSCPLVGALLAGLLSYAFPRVVLPVALLLLVYVAGA